MPVQFHRFTSHTLPPYIGQRTDAFMSRLCAPVSLAPKTINYQSLRGALRLIAVHDAGLAPFFYRWRLCRPRFMKNKRQKWKILPIQERGESGRQQSHRNSILSVISSTTCGSYVSFVIVAFQCFSRAFWGKNNDTILYVTQFPNHLRMLFGKFVKSVFRRVEN